MKTTPSARVFDLEQRLIDFSVRIINLSELLPDTIAAKQIAEQLVRSGTSPALNYGEAQVAESRNDFIHKMKICTKELKETNVSLKIIGKAKVIVNSESIQECQNECEELIRIFVSSIRTAKLNK